MQGNATVQEQKDADGDLTQIIQEEAEKLSQ